MPNRRVYGAVGATEPSALEAVGGESGGGGSGGTVIEDGGALSGVYEGNVVCLGVSTMTGNVEIIGDLLAIGDITNGGGYDFIVRGNANVRDLEFDRLDPSLPQGQLIVQGNMTCDSISFSQGGGLPSTIQVDGDLISEDEEEGIYASGNDDTGGGVGPRPGQPDLLRDPGERGRLRREHRGVRGQHLRLRQRCHRLPRRLPGGSSNTGFSAGDGGSFTVYGDCVVGSRVDLDGGQGTNSSGGNGGYIRLYGNGRIQDIDARGGACNSTNHTHRAGTGGGIEIDGTLVCEEAVSTNGGDRTGALAAAGEAPPANGGEVLVQGDLIVDEINTRGGDILTTVHAATNGGNGGHVTVNGSMVCYGDFNTRGGTCIVGLADGGAGGDLDVEGDASITLADLTGGASEGGQGGPGGSTIVHGSLVLHSSYNSTGGACTSGTRAGNAGSITVYGAIYSQGNITAVGGACTSPNNEAVSGVGGDVTCGSLTIAGLNGINLSCGARSGATLSTTVAPAAVNCQSLTVYGDATVFYVTGNGAPCSTDYPCQTGGAGLTVDIRGSLHADEVYLNGGASVGLNGGAGGSLSVGGLTRCGTISLIGGDSGNSVGVGGDAATNGAGGSALFSAGGVLTEFVNTDGAGAGVAPVAGTSLLFGGSMTFGTISSPNRAGSLIKASPQVVLKIESMTAKVTLNNDNDTATGSIAAELATCIFASGGGG